MTECPYCGEHPANEPCPWLATCRECGREGVDMHSERLCVECHESIERAKQRQKIEEYADGCELFHPREP